MLLYLFSLIVRGTKKKETKKKCRFRGAIPLPRHLLKKVDENFPNGFVRTHTKKQKEGDFPS